jgi:cation/acetate symporter
MTGNQPIELPNTTAIIFFLIFIGITIGITWWAARRTKSTEEYFAAGRQLTALQNGFALAGDFTAAAGFLGIVGFISLAGFDGLVYAMSSIVGWPLMLFLFAGPLRRLGTYTFADALAFRLNAPYVRLFAGINSLVFILLFLIVQMVGAGNIVQLMFGLPYNIAIVTIGIIMIGYAFFGGMLAATWVQIIKGLLMLIAAVTMLGLALASFHFNPLEMLSAVAAKNGPAVLAPGGGFPNGWETISIGIGALCGLASQPHVLMRVFTVPDARRARASVFCAATIVGLFSAISGLLGFAAMLFVGPAAIKAADPGGNMALPLLAATLGGNGFLGFVAAVSFATILAVVVGLIITGSATLSHDLWGGFIRRGKVSGREQLTVARFATIIICVIAMLLGIAFKGQNLAFIGTLTIAVAGSANFPTLFLAIFWRRLTVVGAIAGMLTGLLSSLLLLYLSPLVQVAILHHAEAIIGLRNPGIISIPLAFLVSISVSLLTFSPKDAARYEEVSKILHGAAS